MAKYVVLCLALCLLVPALASRSLRQSDAERYEAGSAERYGTEGSRYEEEEDTSERYEAGSAERYGTEGSRYETNGAPSPVVESSPDRYGGAGDGSRYGGSPSTSRYGEEVEEDADDSGGRYVGGSRYGEDADSTTRYEGEDNGGRYAGGEYGGRNSTSNTVVWTRGKIYTALNVTVGDTITFTWSGGSPHDVATSSGLGNCNNLVPLVEASEEGVYAVTFDTAGTYYYACSVSDHCWEGQEIAVNVVAAA